LKIIGIDYEKCIACKECIEECPSRLFYEEETKKISFKDPFGRCILCGHCLAVCPEEAVMAEESEGIYEFDEVKNPSKIVNIENLMKIIRARRSIRRFQDKAIPREEIEKILEAMRYAPSGSNLQNWHYIVITDPEKIQHFASEVMKLFYLVKKVLKIKFLVRWFVSKTTRELLLDPKTKHSMEQLISDYKAGRDVIFYKAPCVVILHSPEYGNIAGADGGIALTHGMFAAQALGLGTCWIGFAQEALHRNKTLRKWLNIPKGRKCYGVFVLGYPDVRFQRTPPRRELQVQWL
jgi:nitroreductase/NAD-dependent dihydropyrimidine dehydrogenase PreA subunit